jgi:hypothetical protein
MAKSGSQAAALRKPCDILVGGHAIERYVSTFDLPRDCVGTEIG